MARIICSRVENACYIFFNIEILNGKKAITTDRGKLIFTLARTTVALFQHGLGKLRSFSIVYQQ